MWKLDLVGQALLVYGEYRPLLEIFHFCLYSDAYSEVVSIKMLALLCINRSVPPATIFCLEPSHCC